MTTIGEMSPVRALRRKFQRQRPTVYSSSWRLTEQAVERVLDGLFAFDSKEFRLALFRHESNAGARSRSYRELTHECPTTDGYERGGKPITLAVRRRGWGATVEYSRVLWIAGYNEIAADRMVIYDPDDDAVIAFTNCEGARTLAGKPFLLMPGPLFTLETEP